MNFVVSTFSLLGLSRRRADAGAVNHLAVEHRVLDDVHGSTVHPSTIAVQGRSGVAVSAQIWLSACALASPGSRLASRPLKRRIDELAVLLGSAFTRRWWSSPLIFG